MALPPPQSPTPDEEAGKWMHRGINLLNANTPSSLEEAIHCFDKAIDLRRSLPLAENPPYQYGLAAGWMNRGDALARLGAKEQLAESIRSYEEALKLLRTLPLAKNPLYPRRLTIALINCGFTWQKEESTVAKTKAIDSFRESLAVLDDPSAMAIIDLNLLRAGAMANLAGALLDIPDGSLVEARMLAHHALSLIKEMERNDPLAAEAGFKARHVLCRAIAGESHESQSIPSELIALATDAVDEGLALARSWEQRGRNDFRALAEDLFHFGCRIYQIGQPHFLSEFILETLDPGQTVGAIPLNQKTHDAAVAALWNALKEIQQNGFRSFSTPRFEQVLDSLHDLRVAEKRLEQLRQLATRQSPHNYSASNPLEEKSC